MEVRLLVAWNLRRLRVAKDLSQEELAFAAGVERAYVGHLERATKNPTIVTLEKLATTLECDIAELFREPPLGAQSPEPMRPGRRKK